MQPINYLLQNVDPVAQIEAGMSAGLQRQAQRQDMGLRAAQNARAEEMQPIAVEQARANVDSMRLSQEQVRQQIEQRRAQQARTEAFQNSVASLGMGATFDDYAQISTQFPEFAGAINETWGALSEGRRAGISNRLTQIASSIKSGNLDLAQRLATEYADAAENSGDQAAAATARAMADIIKTEPEAALASLGLTLSSVSPDVARQLFGEGAKVQSSKIVGNGRVSVQTMTDGTTRVVDMTTNQPLEGEAAADAIAQAETAEAEAQGSRAFERTSQSNIAETETGSQAKAAESLGALQSKFVENAAESLSNVSSAIANYDRAIQAIDEGGSAGAVARYLPDITKASAELTNAMNNLGLNVIGSVTFGALSEGELRLAMDVAVPRNLRGPQLREWLVERRDAQEKVRAAIQEQQRFLSNPNNSLQDWYERVYEGGDQADFDPEARGMKPGATQADFDRVQSLGQRLSNGETISDSDKAFLDEVMLR